MKERLLVAKSAEVQLQLAQELLRKATANLAALKLGAQPSLDAAKKALHECEKAYTCTTQLIERIPE